MFIINLVDRFDGAFETAFAEDEKAAVAKAKELMDSYREDGDGMKIANDKHSTIVTVEVYGEEIDIFAHVAPATVRFTNAPVDYDYRTVKTIETLANGWRKIAVTDLEHFERFQAPRYASGWHTVFENESDIPK